MAYLFFRNNILNLVLGHGVVGGKDQPIGQERQPEGGVPHLAELPVLLQVQGLIRGDFHLTTSNS